MKITFISIYSSIKSTSLRTLSAILKSKGYDVQLIFMKRRSTEKYKENEILELIELIKGTQLVGLSVMTNYFDNAVQLTKSIKESLSVPVIWGGIHATVRPEESLEYADIVSIGYADESILELADKIRNGINYTDVAGMWFNLNGKIIKNKLRPYPNNLDDIPFQDYDYKSHHILTEKGILTLTEEFMDCLLNGEYMTQPTRGCPFACTYCCNNAYIKIFPEEKPHFKKRSIDNVIVELKWVKKNLPFVRYINFNDDAFLFYTEKEIEYFAHRFKNEVDIPLSIGGTTPTSLTYNKIKLLVEGGLTGIRPGIQTESEIIKKLYKRNYSRDKTLQMVNLIHQFKTQIPLPRYDIIVNNPWEKDEDLIETLMFLAKVPVPFELNMFSLNFYPGTELYEKAKQDGLIKDDLNDVYRVSYNVKADGLSGGLINESYFNNLFYLVYVYALNGIKISEKQMKTLTDIKNNKFKAKGLYFFMKLKARYLLTKRYIKDSADKTTRYKTELIQLLKPDNLD